MDPFQPVLASADKELAQTRSVLGRWRAGLGSIMRRASKGALGGLTC